MGMLVTYWCRFTVDLLLMDEAFKEFWVFGVMIFNNTGIASTQQTLSSRPWALGISCLA